VRRRHADAPAEGVQGLVNVQTERRFAGPG
jgi:hypothetical protein